jgi:2'-5' RNA ligase
VSRDGLRTAIVILLDELAPEVAAARYELGRYGRNEVELHVTLLFPFVPRARVDDAAVEALRDFFARRRRPSFTLARVASFAEGAVYAAPEPAAPLVELIEALAARFPETPPYEGAHDDVVPHATLAYGDGDEAAVRALVEPLLPVACAPERASLIEEHEPFRWRELEPLSFAEAA